MLIILAIMTGAEICAEAFEAFDVFTDTVRFCTFSAWNAGSSAFASSKVMPYSSLTRARSASKDE